MALPFETRTVDERIQDRAEKARERGAWPRQTRAEKIIYDMAVFIATEKEALEAGFRIRIHLIQIRVRIQHFRLNTDSDPIRIQAFDDQKLKKISAEKRN
jgi:hypothetical protein